MGCRSNATDHFVNWQQNKWIFCIFLKDLESLSLMKNALLKNPIFLFFLKFFVLYVAWYFIYDVWLHPKKTIDLWMANNLVDGVKVLLKAFDYQLINFANLDREYRAIGIDGSNGVYVGDNCNGLSLFAIYIGFIIAFSGKLLPKIVFSIMGILIIHIFNIVRIFGLCLIAYYKPSYLDFNHTYTFTVLMYIIIFGLWYIWLNRYSSIARKIENKKS